jgi:hypothetical protein
MSEPHESSGPGEPVAVSGVLAEISIVVDFPVQSDSCWSYQQSRWLHRLSIVGTRSGTD